VRITRRQVRHTLDVMRRLLAGQAGRPANQTRASTVQQYLDLVREDPTTDWILTECPAPEAVMGMVDLRPLGIERVVPGYGDPATPDPATGHSLMFIANPGNASDLHTDWDGRDVLLYQVFGRKRVTLFPPDSASQLLPISVFGTVKLHGMPAEARREFVHYARGWDDILEPGEAVFMPAFYWHHLEYIDLALSFSFRFGGLQQPDARFLLRHAHRDMHLQNILAASLLPETADRAAPLLSRLRQTVQSPQPSARAKYRAVMEGMRQAYAELCPGLPNSEGYTWFDCTNVLDGILCSTYMSAPPEMPQARRWYWTQKERLRFLLRLWGYRLANWA
jgi:lysine-specific demethylase 8